MIDHLVYATMNLADSVDGLNSRLGVSLTTAGQRIGLGTRNYLADLGDCRPVPREPRRCCAAHADGG